MIVLTCGQLQMLTGNLSHSLPQIALGFSVEKVSIRQKVSLNLWGISEP